MKGGATKRKTISFRSEGPKYQLIAFGKKKQMGLALLKEVGEDTNHGYSGKAWHIPLRGKSEGKNNSLRYL